MWRSSCRLLRFRASATASAAAGAKCFGTSLDVPVIFRGTLEGYGRIRAHQLGNGIAAECCADMILVASANLMTLSPPPCLKARIIIGA